MISTPVRSSQKMGNSEATVVATVITFGKFHDHTLGQIAAFEPSYIDWVAGTVTWTPKVPEPAAFRRAETAHGEHEKRTGGGRDANWPEWYAAYMVAEGTGGPLPL